MELAGEFDRSWLPGKVAVTVIEYDWVSNTVVTEIRDARVTPAEVNAMAPSPFLRVPQGAPPDCGSRGAGLSIPAVVGPTDPIPVTVALRLPHPAVVAVPAPHPPGSVVLPCSLLLLKLDEAAVLANLLIPVAAQPAVPGFEAVASFDLRDSVHTRNLAGTYQVYLVAGALVAGPYPMTVGTP